jgi:cbb3-type cytochrome oxidase subunit 1
MARPWKAAGTQAERFLLSTGAAGVNVRCLAGLFRHYRPAHAHMNVVGFLTMLVFGVGYQLLPRLFGHPLHSRRLAIAHLFCANLGLASLVLGFLIQPYRGAEARWATGTGGLLFAAGAMLWVYNLWRTFDAADARQRVREDAAQRPLPTLEN